MYDRVAKDRRLFGWVFIPVMFLTGAAMAFGWQIWTSTGLETKKIPLGLLALAVAILWVLVLATFKSYRKSVKLSRIHTH